MKNLADPEFWCSNSIAIECGGIRLIKYYFLSFEEFEIDLSQCAKYERQEQVNLAYDV